MGASWCLREAVEAPVLVVVEEVNGGGAVLRGGRAARERRRCAGVLTVLGVLLRLVVPVLQRCRHTVVEDGWFHRRAHLHEPFRQENVFIIHTKSSPASKQTELGITQKLDSQDLKPKADVSSELRTDLCHQGV